MTKLIPCLMLIAVMFYTPQQAAAHVLMRDATANIGAIVHINPDDDPVAGEVTKMYIDIQDSEAKVRIPRDAYEVYVQPNGGMKERVETTITGNIIQIEYTFKAKGLYSLEVVSKQSHATFQKVYMSYAIRVSRGIGQNIAVSKKFIWAETTLYVSLVVLSLLLIVGRNNWQQILAKSKL